MKSTFTSSLFLYILLFTGLMVSCDKQASLEPIDTVNLEEGLKMYFPFAGNSVDKVSGIHYDTHGASYVNDRFNKPKSALCLTKNYMNINAGMTDSIGTLSFWLNVPDIHFWQEAPLFVGGEHILGVHQYGVGVREGKVSLISFALRWGVLNDGNFEPLMTASVLKSNKWHHIVVRWSDTDELVEIFVDSKKELSAGYLPGWHLAEDEEGRPSQYMGAVWNYGGHDVGEYLSYFKGQVDEIRHYTRRISDKEIEALYTIEE